MNTYSSPLYPALMIRLPGDGRRNVKAAGGVFRIADEDVEAFEAVVAQRPHYKIVRIGETEEEGPSQTLQTDETSTETVVRPESMTFSERHPELVSVEAIEAMNVPTIQERLRDAGLPDDGRKAELVQRLAEALGLLAADDE